MRTILEPVYENSDHRYICAVNSYEGFCKLYQDASGIILDCIERCVFDDEAHFMVCYERHCSENELSDYNVAWGITSTKESFVRKVSIKATVTKPRAMGVSETGYCHPKNLDDLFLNSFIKDAEPYKELPYTRDGVLMPIDYHYLSLPPRPRLEVEMTKSLEGKDKNILNIYYESKRVRG